jgi:hypothetical protein
VGVFLKQQVIDSFHVEVLDDTYEDILWIKLKARNQQQALLFCVCYLAPSGSSRSVNAAEFMDTLLGQIYKYHTAGLVCICGDFNARCGDKEDYIEGIDPIPERSVIDRHVNQYGEMLCDMLLSANMCILNGRNCTHNDYTSKDASVVDYVIVMHEQLPLYQNFLVARSHDLFDKAGCTGLNPLRSLPDHNMLQWDLNLPVV